MSLIQIFVVALNSKTITIDLNTNDTITTLYKLITKKLKYPPHIFNINFNGKRLRKDALISESGIEKECTIRLTPIMSNVKTYEVHTVNKKTTYKVHNCRASDTVEMFLDKFAFQHKNSEIMMTDNHYKLIVNGRIAKRNDNCKDWSTSTSIYLVKNSN